MDIVGPAILLIVLVWLVMRRGSTGKTGRTEQATRELYAEEEAAPARGDRQALSDACRRVVSDWFESRGLAAAAAPARDARRWRGAGRSALLVAATGAGKTLAGFLPTHLRACRAADAKGLHTLYVSPLKALAVDVQRNLHRPDRGDGAADPRRDAHRRHAVRPQGAAAGEAAADAADHARIAEPAAELPGQPRRCSKACRTIVVDELHAFANGEARRPAVAVDVAAADARARPAPRRPVGDDRRSRRLSRAGSRPTRDMELVDLVLGDPGAEPDLVDPASPRTSIPWARPFAGATRRAR